MKNASSFYKVNFRASELSKIQRNLSDRFTDTVLLLPYSWKQRGRKNAMKKKNEWVEKKFIKGKKIMILHKRRFDQI